VAAGAGKGIQREVIYENPRNLRKWFSSGPYEKKVTHSAKICYIKGEMAETSCSTREKKPAREQHATTDISEESIGALGGVFHGSRVGGG
jgi:hypothetical protein